MPPGATLIDESLPAAATQSRAHDERTSGFDPVARYSAQLDALFRRTRTSSLLALPPIALLAGLHVGRVPTGSILMWTLAILGVHAIRIGIAHGYLTRPRDGDPSPLWLDVETMATAAAGTSWGAMMFLLDSGRLDMLFTVKLAFLAAACAFTMNSMAVLRFVTSRSSFRFTSS